MAKCRGCKKVYKGDKMIKEIWYLQDGVRNTFKVFGEDAEDIRKQVIIWLKIKGINTDLNEWGEVITAYEDPTNVNMQKIVDANEKLVKELNDVKD